MGGIAGIYCLDGRPVERTDVQRMMDGMAHRGPDGSGVWCDGSVGLGHQMLWTTPESLNEKLPFTNQSGDLAITADARIDNRDELIPLLNFNGRPREKIPDGEVILAAYGKWGEQCPEKLLGDFSFVIWDKQKRKLFCARDPIGIKPFYYHFDGRTFRWASEPRAIFEGSTIPKEPNLTLMCLYLLNRFDEREETLYKNIYRLPGSQFMVLEDGKLRKGEYWDIDPNYSIRYKTDEEYAEHFLTLFKEAVKAQLRSHSPIGVLLSGGLDSSSIVCTAQLLYKKKSIPGNGLETFSLVYDQLPCDERFYIKEVVRKWNLKANYFYYEENPSWVDFERIQHYSDVAYHPTILGYGPVLEDAQERGIRVMLDGIGGDNLLTVDFNHLTDLLIQGDFRKLVFQLKCDAKVFSRSPFRLLFKYCLKPLIPQTIELNLKRCLGKEIPPWINITYLKKAGVYERLRPLVYSVQFPTRSQQRIYEELLNGWDNNVAQTISEGFFPHFNIENRHPFYDRRLIEFLIALPEGQRWRNESPKWVLRQAMDGILPESIRNRKDVVTFSALVSRELKERQAAKVDKLIQTSVLAGFGVIHSDRLQKLFTDYCTGKASNGLRNILDLFVWLELWLRQG